MNIQAEMGVVSSKENVYVEALTHTETVTVIHVRQDNKI